MNFSKVVVLIPCHGMEDFPTHFTRHDAQGLLAAFVGVWHPSLIERAGRMPTWSSTDFIAEDLESSLIVIPQVSEHRICRDISEELDKPSVQVAKGFQTRTELLRLPVISDHIADCQINDSLVNDFFALGYCFLQIQLMTRQLRYSTQLDLDDFGKLLVDAAKAATHGETESARTSLQACFDLLLEERNQYYPVQPQFLDMVLVAPTTLGTRFQTQLESQSPMNLVATGEASKTLKENQPQALEKIREQKGAGRLDWIGTSLVEVPSQLVSVPTILNQIQLGKSIVQEVSGFTPAFFARRRFGFCPSMVNLLQNMGYGGVAHCKFDAGTYPAGSSTCINWEGSDGSTINAVIQPPVDAGQDTGFLNLGITIGEALDSAHHSTVLFFHWPDRVSDSFRDLQNSCKFGPILGEFTLASDYLDSFYDPGYSERYTVDEYQNPWLRQCVNSNATNPLSQVVDYWRNEFHLGAIQGLLGLSTIWLPTERQQWFDLADQANDLLKQNGLSLVQPEAKPLASDVNQLTDTVTLGIQHALDNPPDSPAGGKTNAANASDSDAIVVLNPSSFSRRVFHQTKQKLSPTRNEDSIVFAAPCDSGTELVVDVPAYGAICIPNNQSNQKPGNPFRKDPNVAEELSLQNEYFELRVDPTTGGIRNVHKQGLRGTLLSQQLSLRIPGKRGPGPHHGQSPRYCKMVADSTTYQNTSAIAGSVTSVGHLIDPGRPGFAFSQIYPGRLDRPRDQSLSCHT